jgi:hypothetical protein
MQACVYQAFVMLNQIVHKDLGVVSDLESVKYAKKTVNSVLYHSMTQNVVAVSVIYHHMLLAMACVRPLLLYHRQSTKKVSTATNTVTVVFKKNAIATISVLVASTLQLFVYKIKIVVRDNVNFIQYLKQ